jgi:hypothetical protein
MAMSERRAAPRVKPAKEIPAKVRAFLPARVVDISPTGVQLELSSLLRIGVQCDVRLVLGDEEIRWPATVRRCRATGFGLDEAGQKVLLYRAGLEFAPMSEGEWAKLRGFLQQEAAPGIEVARQDIVDTNPKDQAPGR